MATEPVKIRVANQKGYLWDLNDIQHLRVQHHICGVLQGTLPQVTQQNTFLGLPLVLLPEEVVLLVKNRIAVLVDDPRAHLDPTLSQSTSYGASRQAAIESQQRSTHEFEQRRKVEMERLHRDKIDAKRKGKLEKRKAALDDAGDNRFDVFVPDLDEGQETTGPPETAPVPSTSASSPSRPPTDERSPMGSDTLARPDVSSIPYTIVIDPTSSSYPWYDPELASTQYSTLEDAAAAKVWNYPTNALEQSRCGVFEDLWRKGYYMGGGLRFGGDFLVYPGDPLRYHSHFTLTVLSTPTSSISPLDLVAYGRLATAVKKAHLLASYDEDEHKAEFLSLEWAAFG
ncbi:hypothetical protein JCM10212_001771 [Sporobolomyces blumeae]